MPNLLDLQKSSAQKIIVFGPPKSGKTLLIGKLAVKYQLIWFDLEYGVDTLRQLPRELQANITVIRIKDTLENPRAHATIDKIVKGGKFKICDDHGTVDCATCLAKKDQASWTEVEIPAVENEDTLKKVVVIDSASQLTVSVNATVTLSRSETYKETFDDWAAQGKYLNRILSRIQQAPYHCIVTAHEVLAEREDGSKRIVPSIGTVNYASNCSKFFGHSVYVDKQNLKHRAWSDTTYSNNVLTGSRLNVKVEAMEVPDLLPMLTGEVAPNLPSKAEQKAKILNTLESLKLK